MDFVVYYTNIFGQDNVLHITGFDAMQPREPSYNKNESIIFFFLGLVYVVMVYSYILSKRVKRFSIYAQNGASKRLLLGISFVGGIFIYTVSFVLGYLLTVFLSRVLFEPILPFETLTLEWGDISEYFIFLLTVYLVVLGIFMTTYAKNTIVSIYRRSE